MKKTLLVLFLFFINLSLCFAQYDFQVNLKKSYAKSYLIAKIRDKLNKQKLNINNLSRSEMTNYLSLPEIDFLDSEYLSLGKETKSPFMDIKIIEAKIDEDLRKEEKKENLPDILNKGFIELYSNGSTKGAVQLIKVRIGEPSYFGVKRLSFPLYVFVGAKGNNISSDNKDIGKEALFNDLLDPLGGIINFHFADMPFNLAESNFKMTYVSLAYQIGGKLMNAEDKQTNKNIVFLNGYSSFGLSFQTAAWEENNEDNMGLFWVQLRYLLNFFSKNRLMQIFNDHTLKTVMPGIGGEIGLIINKRINFRIGYYQFLNKVRNPNLSFLNQSLFKITLDYSGKEKEAKTEMK